MKNKQFIRKVMRDLTIIFFLASFILTIFFGGSMVTTSTEAVILYLMFTKKNRKLFYVSIFLMLMDLLAKDFADAAYWGLVAYAYYEEAK